MGIFDKQGQFLFPNDGKATKKQEKQTEKENQDRALELMQMYQQYHERIQEKQYALRGSVLACEYGEKYARLDCVEDHGIIKGKHPIFTALDCLNEHIHDFGSCLCPESSYKDRLPMTSAVDTDGNVAKKAEGNAFPHICIPLVDENHGWLQTEKKVMVQIDGGNDAPMLKSDAVLVCQYGGIIGILEVPDIELEQKQQGSRLGGLTKKYIEWLSIAEGSQDFIVHPFRVMSENKNLVTIGHGITFNKESDEERKQILLDCFGWDDTIINDIVDCLYGSKVPEEGRIEESEEKDDDGNPKDLYYTRYTITPEQESKAFSHVAEYYIDKVNKDIEMYENENKHIVPYYSQPQLEAMFDFEYQANVSEENVLSDEYMIYYFLYIDKDGALDALSDPEDRRRVNRLNLFFCENYNFSDDTEGVLNGVRNHNDK